MSVREYLPGDVQDDLDESGGSGRLRSELRQLVRDHYDHQKLRIQMGNRLAGQFRRDLGQEPGKPTEEMDEEAKGVLDRLKGEWPRLADAVAKTPTRRWPGLLEPHRRAVLAATDTWITQEERALEEGADPDSAVTLDAKALKKRRAELEARKRELSEGRIPYITTPQQIAMVRHYLEMERSEVQLQGFIGILVEQFPLWHYLSAEGPDGASGVKGCGPLMAAVLVSELDPAGAQYESSFWRYAGLDVSNEDGKGRSRRKEHQIKRTYIDRNGVEQERDSLTYNPFLKSKLMGALAPSLMRARGHYYEQYAAYRHRLESHPRYGITAYERSAPVDGVEDEERKILHREARKSHRHDMAMRYMVKLFLADLWAHWRHISGLPVAPFYAQAKLGLPLHRAQRGGKTITYRPDYQPFRQYWPAQLENERVREEEDDDG